jgi:hypothetical protein
VSSADYGLSNSSVLSNQTKAGKDVSNTLSSAPQDKKPVQLPNTSKPKVSQKKTRDPSKLLQGVIFVLSGFQNPLRDQVSDYFMLKFPLFITLSDG